MTVGDVGRCFVLRPVLLGNTRSAMLIAARAARRGAAKMPLLLGAAGASSACTSSGTVPSLTKYEPLERDPFLALGCSSAATFMSLRQLTVRVCAGLEGVWIGLLIQGWL